MLDLDETKRKQIDMLIQKNHKDATGTFRFGNLRSDPVGMVAAGACHEEQDTKKEKHVSPIGDINREIAKDFFMDDEKKINTQKEPEKLRLRVRYDYRGITRPSRFFFGGKNSEAVAEEIREQKMALWQNIPLQGITVEDVRVYEVYTINETIGSDIETVSYAPVEITIRVASLEDCAVLVSQEEFRKVEILEPEKMILRSKDIEKLFVRFNEYLQRFIEDSCRNR